MRVHRGVVSKIILSSKKIIGICSNQRDYIRKLCDDTDTFLLNFTI